MLATPARTANGRRICDLPDLRILAFIRRARELGFLFGQDSTRLAGLGHSRCPALQIGGREPHVA
jgi:hypothetical protein